MNTRNKVQSFDEAFAGLRRATELVQGFGLRVLPQFQGDIDQAIELRAEGKEAESVARMEIAEDGICNTLSAWFRNKSPLRLEALVADLKDDFPSGLDKEIRDHVHEVLHEAIAYATGDHKWIDLERALALFSAVHEAVRKASKNQFDRLEDRKRQAAEQEAKRLSVIKQDQLRALENLRAQLAS